jgi:putative MFS transporter
MQTGTALNLKNDLTTNISDKKLLITVVFLCIGYFIDFYDLTVFHATYVAAFRDLFGIFDTAELQKLFLKMSSCYTLGIVLGAILFGVLGDKFGRLVTIRFSIAIYSFSMIASVMTHSILFFTILRFLSGVGLATEFATSSVILSELFPSNKNAKYMGLLYTCGILGGMTATYLSPISWRFVYVFGGVAGVVIYILRKQMLESTLFLQLEKCIVKGNVFLLFNSWQNIIKISRLFIMNLTFSIILSIIFILPRFMPIKQDLLILNKTLLAGFFIGNLLSTFFASYIVRIFKNYKTYLFMNILFFILFIPLFQYVTEDYFLLYSIALGLLGGGAPTVWMQIVVRSYGTNQRNTAANTLFAIGRLFAIVMNVLIVWWLKAPEKFATNVTYLTFIVGTLVIISLIFTKNSYYKDMKYTE